MSERASMQTGDSANEQRVNRIARQMLIQIGLEPDSECVHSVQLMQWALGECIVRRSEVDLSLMREAVAALSSSAHEEVMGVLDLSDDAPDKPGLQPRHLIGKPPREVAAALLRHLAMRLSAGARCAGAPIAQTQSRPEPERDHPEL